MSLWIKAFNHCRGKGNMQKVLYISMTVYCRLDKVSLYITQ